MADSKEQDDPLAEWLTGVATTAAGELESAGSLYEQGASIEAGGAVVSTASVAGEKDTNEDSIAMWIPPAGSPVRWASAIADGVSACLHPHLASRLACAAGLVEVQQNAAPPCNVAPGNVSPVRAAQQQFDRLAGIVETDPEALRPPNTTSSMWKRVLRDGAYAQTTLIVLWQDESALHIEGIGDGGIVVNLDGDPFEFLPQSNRPVNCLGPGRTGLLIDYRLTFPHWSRVAVFTDGMTPWVREGGRVAMHRIGEGNEQATADQLVERCLQETPVRDNVSLLVVDRETT